MKILNFGSCNIDSVYNVDHILRPGETIAATGAATFPGGKGLNQTIALARAGAKVYHAGCIGEDGRFLLESMESSGADTRYMRFVDDKTGLAIIQVDKNAENAIVIYSGANGRITREHIDAVLEDFEAGDLMLTQNEISEIPYLIHKAAARGLRVVWNPSPFHDSLRKIDLADIAYLILNEVEAEGLWGYTDTDKIQSWIQEQGISLTVVLTLGKRGSAYINCDRILQQKAFLVDSVDTTAAGDTFTGYFMACISQGQDAESAMRIASAASALTVSRKGASSSIPYMKEVREKLPVLKSAAISTDAETTEKVHSFFQAHYSDGNLQMLAGELGYTPTYVSAWLKKHMNTTFTQQLQNQKCAIAAQLLRGSSLTVAQIIQQVGYRNESFFREKFRSQYGSTPLQYRKKDK